MFLCPGSLPRVGSPVPNMQELTLNMNFMVTFYIFLSAYEYKEILDMSNMECVIHNFVFVLSVILLT